MTQIYITRHGQTEWNIERRVQGSLDSPLTQIGIEQAKQLKERLNKISFNAVYSSPKKRALDTAGILSNDPSKIKVMDDLREMSFGKLEGQLFDELGELYPDTFGHLFNAPHLYTPMDGETYEEVTTRAIKCIEAIVESHPNEKVLVVAHGITVKAIMTYYEKRELKYFWKEPIIHQTSLSLIEFNEHANIKLYGDISHIE